MIEKLNSCHRQNKADRSAQWGSPEVPLSTNAGRIPWSSWSSHQLSLPLWTDLMPVIPDETMHCLQGSPRAELRGFHPPPAQHQLYTHYDHL